MQGGGRRSARAQLLQANLEFARPQLDNSGGVWGWRSLGEQFGCSPLSPRAVIFLPAR